jgi:hypothetical protein
LYLTVSLRQDFPWHLLVEPIRFLHVTCAGWNDLCYWYGNLHHGKFKATTLHWLARSALVMWALYFNGPDFIPCIIVLAAFVEVLDSFQ